MQEEYCGDSGLKCSFREFDLIQHEIPEGSGKFLVKQVRNSVVAELRLTGFADELAVLSARTNNVELVRQLLKTHGNHPQAWLPEFFKRRSSE